MSSITAADWVHSLSMGSQGPWIVQTIPPAALADFLAGNVQSFHNCRGNPERFVVVNAFNLYFQDSWQVTKRLKP